MLQTHEMLLLLSLNCGRHVGELFGRRWRRPHDVHTRHFAITLTVTNLLLLVWLMVVRDCFRLFVRLLLVFAEI
jgi:hypothetical protein